MTRVRNQAQVYLLQKLSTLFGDWAAFWTLDLLKINVLSEMHAFDAHPIHMKWH